MNWVVKLNNVNTVVTIYMELSAAELEKNCKFKVASSTWHWRRSQLLLPARVSIHSPSSLVCSIPNQPATLSSASQWRNSNRLWIELSSSRMSKQWWPTTWSWPLLSWRRIANSILLPQHKIEEEASYCCPQVCQSIHQGALCVQIQTSQQDCQVLPNEEIQGDGELSGQAQECQGSGDQLHGAGRCWVGEK